MLILVSLMLPFLVILGLSFFFSSLFNVPLSLCFFISTACMGVFLFLSALTNNLYVGSFILLCSGLLLVGRQVQALFFREAKEAVKQQGLILGFYTLSALCLMVLALGLHFRTIDDYSFWGTISKYLFVFQKLPKDSQYIEPYFLTYLPGMACFHYLFYYVSGQYAQFIGYFAQGLILLSVLFVLFDTKHPRKSLLYMALAYIALSIGFGTVFARMEVDAYVAAYVFAIFWLLYQYRDHKALPYILFFPLMFLSLIKEIGFLFAIMGSIAYLLRAQNKRDVFFFCVFILSLLALKGAWFLHCQHLGFHSFAKKIHWNNALASLNPWNKAYQGAQKLFLKGVLFEKFGPNLAWPNLISYLLLAFIWRALSYAQSSFDYVWAVRLAQVFLSTLLLYLLMLYFLQAIVFEVGTLQSHLLDFQRYLNMLLIPFTLFSVLLYFEKKKEAIRFAFLPAVSLALLFIIGGKIERSVHYYPAKLYPQVEAMKKNIPEDGNWVLCLENPPTPVYETTLPLRYFFLPHKVQLLAENQTCDYLLRWSQAGVLIKEARNAG